MKSYGTQMNTDSQDVKHKELTERVFESQNYQIVNIWG